MKVWVKVDVEVEVENWCLNRENFDCVDHQTCRLVSSLEEILDDVLEIGELVRVLAEHRNSY